MDIKTRKEQIIKLVNSNSFRELSSFYTQKSFFNILNISRKETAHSDFLTWLFNPNSNHELGSYALCKLLETIIIPLNREQQLNRAEKFPEDLEDVIISGNYGIQNIEVEREKTSEYGSIDICIQMEVLIQKELDNKRRIRIILENKVKSKEGESQTKRYYVWAKNQDEMDGFRSIFVYLTPLNNVEYERLIEPECECKSYIQINYQYLMDYVIDPCRKMKLPHEAEIFIDNYIRTLSFPALQMDINEKERGDIIMAISQRERDLLRNFWEANKELLIATITALRDDPEITDEEREKISNGLEAVIKTSTRDNTRYRFDGAVLSKNRLVLAVVKKYVEQHPGITFAELKMVFSDELQGTRWGVIRRKEDADRVFAESGYHRYFDKDEEIITLSDAKVAVCNQWGKPKIDEFVLKAINLEFEVTKE